MEQPWDGTRLVSSLSWAPRGNRGMLGLRELWLLPHPNLLVPGVAVSQWRPPTAQTTVLPESSLFLLTSRPASLSLSSWIFKPPLLSLVGRRHPLLSLLPLLPPTACFPDRENL